jgi:hypothetical protein
VNIKKYTIFTPFNSIKLKTNIAGNITYNRNKKIIMKITLELEKTDRKIVIVKKKHDVKNEDEHKFKDLPLDEEITLFTLHKEFYGLDKDEKIKLLKGLIDFSVDEIIHITKAQ